MARQMPAPGDYQQILRNLHVALVPTQLKTYTFVPGKRGPIIYSGGFVMTSPIEETSRRDKLALRLFYRLPDDMEKRYRAISAFVQQHSGTGLFADVTYIERGVTVNGQVYPICTMQWLEGDTLRNYVSKNINNPQKIQPMADNFLKMIEKLRRTGGAHGDLSHDNIMLVNDEFRLVDYDGMYVPDLNGFPPVVAGQDNFQHPERIQTPGYFGPYQDDFSAIAIYISLGAMAFDPGLYNRYENGGNSLLFKKDDFKNPNDSPFLAEVEALNPQMATLAQGFREVCSGDLLHVPSLSDFLRGKRSVARITVNPTALAGTVIFSQEGSPVFNATSPNRERLLSAQGHVAVVAGKVHAVHQRTDQFLLEFSAGGVSTTFVVFIEGDAYEALQKQGNLQSYQGAWVKVTGLVELNEINGETIPAIVTDSLQDVTLSTQAQVLSLFRTGNETLTSAAPTEAQTSWRKKQLMTREATEPSKGTANTGSADGALGSLRKKDSFGSLTDN